MRWQQVKHWVTSNGAAIPALAMAMLSGGPLLARAVEFSGGGGIANCSQLFTVLDRFARFGGGIVVAIATIVFLIGAFYFLFSGGSEEAVKKGRSLILYGAVGIVVALIAFSLPTLIRGITGIQLPTCPI